MSEIFIENVAVVIPCYRERSHILSVLEGIGGIVKKIYVIDDACPDKTGDYVNENCCDSRVSVLYHQENKGVGGAVISGYLAALKDEMQVVVKMDGDGQMDPSLLNDFIEPILAGDADYTKGNRFYDLDNINQMPKMRILGNAVLSFMTKLSSGYWPIFDPTNGYTAIHTDVLKRLSLKKISHDYFFESDMLFRLNIIRAVVMDVPIHANYGRETSHLNIKKIIPKFMAKHLKNFGKRIFYNYYLRDMSIASIELPVGILMIVFGLSYGIYHWLRSLSLQIETASGTVMMSALPINLGVLLVLGFLSYDIRSVPNRALHRSRQFARGFVLRKKKSQTEHEKIG